MTRNPRARWRIPRPVPLRAWVWDSRGRECITPIDIDCDHRALHQLVAGIGERLFEVVRLPPFWPFSGATSAAPQDSRK